MVDKPSLICPQCGVAMNHHSDKLLYPTDVSPVSPIDPIFEGSMEEFHTCPKCGGAASRPAL
jgi:ribosomal protein S27AE